MYLSQLILDPRSRQVRSELARPYELHRTIMGGFVPMQAGERVLYRLDLSARDGIPRLLVQSLNQPDWTKLESKPGYFLNVAGGNPEVKEYDPCYSAGQQLGFRLLANPTRSVKVESEKTRERGKRVTIGRAEGQAAWLERKGSLGGFRILVLRISSMGEQRMQVPDKEGVLQPARHWGVRFDGVLEVIDPDTFRQVLEHGIGSAKGFGYGLLSVALI